MTERQHRVRLRFNAADAWPPTVGATVMLRWQTPEAAPSGIWSDPVVAEVIAVEPLAEPRL